jgi:regulator of protease activity HflC (stomatin/prohibitin superfamily)
MVEPGHRGLLFKPWAGGLQTRVLEPGRHYVGLYGRIDDFDVTYSTRSEDMQTISSEGLGLSVRCSVIFRPVVAELYDLDIEIGPNYYQEVIGPQFRTAARGVFAGHSYADLQRNNSKIEEEIRAEIRRRVAGKHVEISAVTMEGVQYAPEIADAIRAKLVGEQEAIRKKVATENDHLQRQLELQHQAEREKLEAETELLKKQHERALAMEQAAIDKLQAETAAQSRIIEARALAEEKRAESTNLTPLMVMMHGFDALAQMASKGTTILLGDWSHAPNFLMPASLMPSLSASQRPVALTSPTAPTHN